MKIVTKFTLFGVFIGVLLASAGLIFYWSSTEVAMVSKKTEIANEIVKDAFTQNVLVADYIENHGERAIAQWKLQQGTIVHRIASYPVDTSDEQHAVDDIKKWVGISLAHFNQLVAITQESTKSAVEQRLEGQLSVDEQTIVNSATSLRNINNAQLVRVRQMTGLIFPMTIVVLGATTILAYVFLVTSISKPIRKLEEGTKIIASGSLDFTLNVDHRHDEFGSLSQSFNSMASRLKKSFEDLKQDKVRDEAILQTMGDGMIIVNAQGNIESVNKTACDLLGYEPSDLEGKLYVDSMGVMDKQGKPAGSDCPFFKALKSRSTFFSEEYTFTRRDGSDLAVSIVASPLVIDNVAFGVTILFRDFSKEKEIDKAKSEFVSIASHQLRMPLTVFRWNMEMLLSGDLGILSEPQRKHVESSYEACKGMIDLVNMFLNINRMELGTLQTKPQTVNLSDLLRGSFNKFREEAERKHIEVHQEYAAEITKIQTDPGVLITVLENLFSNAVKYTPSKGTITITTAKSGGDLKITVRDTGMGIPKNQQDKIFTKLFRAENAKTIDPNGRGLGLYIAKTIITLLNGKIWFESIEGKGTIFYITLPSSITT